MQLCIWFSSLCVCYKASDRALNTLQFLNIVLGCSVYDGMTVVKLSAKDKAASVVILFRMRRRALTWYLADLHTLSTWALKESLLSIVRPRNKRILTVNLNVAEIDDMKRTLGSLSSACANDDSFSLARIQRQAIPIEPPENRPKADSDARALSSFSATGDMYDESSRGPRTDPRKTLNSEVIVRDRWSPTDTNWALSLK